MTLDLKRSHCGTVAVSPDGVMIQPRLWCSPEKYVWVLPMFVLGNSKLVVVLPPSSHTHTLSLSIFCSASSSFSICFTRPWMEHPSLNPIGANAALLQCCMLTCTHAVTLYIPQVFRRQRKLQCWCSKHNPCRPTQRWSKV